MKAICLLTIVVVLTGSGYELNHYRSQFSFYQHQGFDRIRANDFFLKGIPGHPELPVKYLHYIIPPNMKADSVRITRMEITQIPGSYYIYPAQPDVPLCSIPRWVPPDSIIYNSDSLHPNRIVAVVNQGVFDGARLVTIAVYPLQYRPRSRRLFLVNNISFEFKLSGTGIPRRARIRGINTQKTYDAVMTAVVENDWEVPVYYHPPPQLVPEKPPLLQPLTLNPTTVPYLIITNDQIAGMVDAFQPFAEWLTDKGVPALVYPLSQALNRPGEDDAEKLRNFIIDAYNNWGTAWVLLGGDGYVTSGAGPNCVVPFRKGWAYDDTVSGADDDVNTPPSDLYFSDMNGDWDVDNDNRWGEPTHDVVDIYPEVFVGRVLARNSEEANNWVQKILYYEKNGSADPPRFQHTTWVYDSSSTSPFFPLQQTRDRFPDYFIPHHNCNSVDANIAVESLNVSSGLYQIYLHGSSYAFYPRWQTQPPCSVMAYYDGTPGSDIDGLNHLNNENRYYVVYSISCYNAAYDQFVGGDGYPTDTTIADAFTDFYESKGAVAFLGNTRWGWVDPSHYLHDAFCQYLFQGGVYSLGAAEGLSKNFLRTPVPQQQPGQEPPEFPPAEWYVTHSHNLFGSPENEPWINTPGTMDVQHPVSIPVEQPVEFTVTVTAGSNPLEFVRVCLHKPDDIYEIGWTDNSGSVTFDLYAHTTGTIKVTCFRPREGTTQYLPSQTSCEVEPNEGGGQAGKSRLPKELFLTISSPVSAFGNISLSYGLPKDERVQLAVYDLSGRTTMVLKEEMKKAGYYTDAFNLSRLSNGIYWLVLKSGGETRTRKLVLIK